MGWANVLATDFKLATFQGKLITTQAGPQTLCYKTTTDYADDYVENDYTWGQAIGQQSPHPLTGVEISYYKKDDSSAINPETDCIDVSNVPNDADFSYVLEPAYISN